MKIPTQHILTPLNPHILIFKAPHISLCLFLAPKCSTFSHLMTTQSQSEHQYISASTNDPHFTSPAHFYKNKRSSY